MARKRTKIYKSGDKIQVSLNKDLSPEFINWINKQSDLTNFFLYGAQELYKEFGDIDIVNVMPRKIDIDNLIPNNETKEINKPTQEDSNKEPQKNNIENVSLASNENYHEDTDSKWKSIEENKFEGDQFS